MKTINHEGHKIQWTQEVGFKLGQSPSKGENLEIISYLLIKSDQMRNTRPKHQIQDLLQPSQPSKYSFLK